MATEDLLPLFHTDGGGVKSPEVDLETLLAQDSTLQDDQLLSEILGSEGDGLLSLLAPTDTQTAFAPMNFDLSTSPVMHSPTASEGYTSDCSATVRVPSPSSHSSVSDQWGDSPSRLTLPDSQYLLGSTKPDGVQPSDVSIDVDLMFCDAVSTSGAATSQELTGGGGKAATLVLTEEEKLLLAQEGIELPMDLPLTKAEQQQLKRIRRKIKNKVSAQESRKRKKEYVEGLEKRVEHCTSVNRKLQKKVSSLEIENRSLLAQLRKLQAMVTEYNPSRMQAGSLLLVVILSFSLFFAPWLRTSPPLQGQDYQSIRAHSSRALLFAETDEFGNVIDPETGRVISEAGGQSPLPPPPWVHQTPAIHNLPKPLEHSHHQKLKDDL